MLFENCVGEVVGATAVASILLMVFSFLWGVVWVPFGSLVGGLAAIWGRILAMHLLEVSIDSGFWGLRLSQGSSLSGPGRSCGLLGCFGGVLWGNLRIAGSHFGLVFEHF